MSAQDALLLLVGETELGFHSTATNPREPFLRISETLCAELDQEAKYLLEVLLLSEDGFADTATIAEKIFSKTGQEMPDANDVISVMKRINIDMLGLNKPPVLETFSPDGSKSLFVRLKKLER